MTSSRQIQTISVDVIRVDESERRQITAANLKTVSDSMREIGLRTPITVKLLGRDLIGAGHSVQLVIGAHRLAAAMRLGWKEIDCFVLPADANDCDVELWEIAENLHRADLTALERDEQISRWVRLIAERKSKTPAQSEEVSDKLSETLKGGRPGVSAAAARDLGINERDVQRAIQVDSIAPKAKTAAKAARLDDNRTALLKVAKEPSAARQVEAVRSLAQQKMDSSILICSAT